jgi:MFS family permease
MTPLWYTLAETPLRHEAWYSFNGVGGIVGDLIAYGVGHITHSAIPQWGLIFVILGVATALWGIYLVLFLPDTPASANFLSPREKQIAIKRVAGNRTGTKNTAFKWEQFREAFRDPK